MNRFHFDFSWYSEFSVKIYCAMNFSNYPLDVQLCPFYMGSSSYSSEQMIFIPEVTFPDNQRPTNYFVRFLFSLFEF